VIVVDTSVWVDVTRRPTSARARAFHQLLDADAVALALPVRIELMGGVGRKGRQEFRRALSALPVLRPSDDTWVDTAFDRGFRFSIPDLMVAALASELEALVWTLDEDFGAMETLGLIRRYDPA
jgi:predicted nucleic acid-binding protein